MDTKDLKGLMEAYSEVYVTQEVNEAVYGGQKKEPVDSRMTVTAADKKGNTKAWQKYKAGHPSYKAAPHLGEEVDIFDVVLKFLQVEGFAETLEEAQEIMANELDADDIEAIVEATYSAKAARAGKDIGKPGKAFAKIAASAGKRYGSKERGEKVAGAVLAKLRAKRG